ncbi:HAMP domain-containing sensor histidine kinase [Paucibacter soli]|uniref:HAMP domain-containing sensor histidine kinase n=1 Tax=Paucibacter soli TaxID=3133433 RepID=UPI00309C8816
MLNRLLPRLYLRFYLALLACLIVLALVSVALWHREGGPMDVALQLMGRLVQNALPPADAPAAEQQAGLQHLAQEVSEHATLHDAQGRTLAQVGQAPPGRRWGRYRLPLPDGRVLLVRLRWALGPPALGLGLHGVMLLLALLVGLLAFPIVRQLTRRLERLQQGVERLGAGELSARVAVEGRDEVARLAQRFNDAAERIEQLVGAHKALLAHASHELRTPLTRIQLALELVKDAVEPRRRAGLEQDIAELDRLIDEILLASRLDAVNEPLQLEELDLLALAAELAAAHAEVQLEGASLPLRADARLLRRLLRNLLENAERHGQPPTRLQLSASGGEAVIRVSDAGPGVPESQREAVFEPFYRGDTRATGSGLGLALVRQIARRHGGTAVCEGQAFVVRLPLDQP